MTPARQANIVTWICLTIRGLCLLSSLFLMFTRSMEFAWLGIVPNILLPRFDEWFSKGQKAKQKEDEEAPKMTAR